MRILHALSQTELTGSEVYAWELCQHQDTRHHDVHIVSDQLHKSFSGKVFYLELSTSSPWKRFRNIFKLRRYVQDRQIEIVHCHSRGACRHLFWALMGTGIPMITTLHGRQHSSFSKKSFDIYGDLVIAICERISEQLKTTFQMDPHKIEVVRNPVTVTEKLSLPPRRRVALIGRASGPKGERLIELMRKQAAHWLSRDSELEIDLVLSGLSDERMRDLRQELPARVWIHGTVPSLVPILARARVVIASGRVAVEAILTDRFVIALGESECLGLVRKENLAQALASNFGDVGPPQAVDTDKVTKDLFEALQKSSTDLHLRLDVEREFNTERICRRIEDLYRGLRLYEKVRWLPILMYHKVVKTEIPTRHRTFVLESDFRKHLQFFTARGFSFLHFSDLADYWFEKKPLESFPRKPIILTFDDGYKNNREVALPLLEKYNVKATIFALADPKMTSNVWDERDGEPREELLSFSEFSRLPVNLIEIGSHGFRHERLTEKNEIEVLQELKESKKKLSDELKRPISVFAYAYGAVDSRLPELAEKAGYDFAVNTDRGPVMWIKNRWSLFRVNVFPEETWFSLWRKTSPWYRRRYFQKRGQ